MQLIPKNGRILDEDDDESLSINDFSLGRDSATSDSLSQLHESKHSSNSCLMDSSKHSQSSSGSSLSTLHNSGTRLIMSVKHGVRNSIFSPSKLVIGGVPGLVGHLTQNKYRVLMEDPSKDTSFLSKSASNDSGQPENISSEIYQHSVAAVADDYNDPHLAKSQGKRITKCKELGTIRVHTAVDHYIQLKNLDEIMTTKSNLRKSDKAPTTPRRSRPSSKRLHHTPRRHRSDKRILYAAKQVPTESLANKTSCSHVASAMNSLSLRSEFAYAPQPLSPQGKVVVDPNIALGRCVTPQCSLSNANIDANRIAAISNVDEPANIGRLTPRFIASSERERVKFDFNPKDIRDLSNAIAAARKNQLKAPSTSKITKPLLDKGLCFCAPFETNLTSPPTPQRQNRGPFPISGFSQR